MGAPEEEAWKCNNCDARFLGKTDRCRTCGSTDIHPYDAKHYDLGP